MKKIQGFSLIEVLVALVVISVGVLGLVALQGRTLQYTNESSQRNTAAMLANDLIELMRSNRSALIGSDGQIRAASNYYKALSADFPTTQIAACTTAAGCTANQMAQTHLAMWSQQVRNSLPVGSDNTLLNSQFTICRTQTPSATIPCSGTGDNVLIQIAWLGKETCPTGMTCTAIDNNRREYYRISFQP